MNQIPKLEDVAFDLVKQAEALYLENDSISPEMMKAEMGAHLMDACLPNCFFCRVDHLTFALAIAHGSIQ